MTKAKTVTGEPSGGVAIPTETVTTIGMKTTTVGAAVGGIAAATRIVTTTETLGGGVAGAIVTAVGTIISFSFEPGDRRAGTAAEKPAGAAATFLRARPRK